MELKPPEFLIKLWHTCFQFGDSIFEAHMKMTKDVYSPETLFLSLTFITVYINIDISWIIQNSCFPHLSPNTKYNHQANLNLKCSLYRKKRGKNWNKKKLKTEKKLHNWENLQMGNQNDKKKSKIIWNTLKMYKSYFLKFLTISTSGQ